MNTDIVNNTEVDGGKYSMPPTQFANKVINLNFNQPCDTAMSKEYINKHIIDLIMANQYLIKKGV